jgi:hypothetical protein
MLELCTWMGKGVLCNFLLINESLVERKRIARLTNKHDGELLAGDKQPSSRWLGRLAICRPVTSVSHQKVVLSYQCRTLWYATDINAHDNTESKLLHCRRSDSAILVLMLTNTDLAAMDLQPT